MRQLWRISGLGVKICTKNLFSQQSGVLCSSPIRFITSVRLAEVGKFASPKLDTNYATGQLFLHKIFGYRGVILFSWQAKLYDRDLVTGKAESEVKPVANAETDVDKKFVYSGYTQTGREVPGSTRTYYQVLIDERDWPFVRAQTESVTFLGTSEGSRSLYAIPGLDYVGQEDILPYTTAEKLPIKHELFDKFLTLDTGKGELCYSAKDTLKAWQEKNYPWLELSDVHRETTEKIRVTVIPFFMGQRDSNSSTVFWWRYSVRLENLGDVTMTLRYRHWRIFSLSGTLETVRGRGVVGTEPVLSRLSPAFQYSSHVSLQAPSGHMWGTYVMEREDGTTFECRIPPFTLESKQEDNPNPSVQL